MANPTAIPMVNPTAKPKSFESVSCELDAEIARKTVGAAEGSFRSLGWLSNVVMVVDMLCTNDFRSDDDDDDAVVNEDTNFVNTTLL